MNPNPFAVLAVVFLVSYIVLYSRFSGYVKAKNLGLKPLKAQLDKFELLGLTPYNYE